MPAVGSAGAEPPDLEDMIVGFARSDVDDGADVDQHWDLLLLCTAGYILTSVGRVHQLFPALEVVHPALLTGLLALALYIHDRHEERRTALVLGPTTRLLGGFLFWMVLAVPAAI